LSPSSAVRVELGERSYDVHVGAGVSRTVCGHAAGAVGSGSVALIADERVARLHGEGVLELLRSAGCRARLETLPPGERAKSLEVVEGLCRRLVSGGLERSDLVLALGGGAAIDAAGFAAAVLLRGVRWASLPTTLLAQVDAAIGGKTGVNLPEGKNLVGAFHQPGVVGCDTAFLATLDAREFRAGLAEVVKTAWIGDAALFEKLEADPPRSADHPAVEEIVRRCAAVKARVVSRDERERGPREVLNFGHTIGHAIETESEGRLLHGEAVSLGLVGAVHMSVAIGRCDETLLARLIRLLEGLGLPAGDRELDTDGVLARTRHDKKRRGSRHRYQLTAGLGQVSVAEDLPENAARAAVEFLRR
jgi:3-dehydroquinate synthase